MTVMRMARRSLPAITGVLVLGCLPPQAGGAPATPPPAQAAAAADQATEPALEKRVVCGPESAAEWSAAESSLAASTRRTPTGQPALHWHITVDHFGGEAKYPIGWPRISRTLPEPLSRDWSGWDYLDLLVYTDTSREALPREPVGLILHTPDKESAYHRPLPELKKGAWVRIRIPLADVPRVQDVRLMQFHISDSNYRHQDELDLHFAEIALLRHARPTLLGFAPECAVIFADAEQVPVRFQVAGIKPGDSAEVTCELWQGGKSVVQTSVRAARGPQRATLDLRGARLAAGSYELRAGIGRGGPTAAAPLRLVASPWQGKEP